MSYLLLSMIALLALISILMTVSTALNAFDNYLLESNKNQLFLASNNKDEYTKLTETTFGVSVATTFLSILLWFLVYFKVFENINIYWLFFIFFISLSLYFLLTGYFLSRTANNVGEISTQSILNWAYGGVTIILSIIIIAIRKNKKIKNLPLQGSQ